MIDIETLASDLASDDQIKVYKAERTLDEQTAAVGSEDETEQRQKLAAALAEAIAAADPSLVEEKNRERRPYRQIAARKTLLRYLAMVAGDEQIDVIKQAMHDRDCREMARWALDRIQCESATAALIEAIDLVGNDFRIGVINALAKREGEAVVETLKKCVSDPAPQVRLAAAEALADHADADADAAIVQAGRRSGPRGRLRTEKARLRLAETLLNDGRHAAAAKICEEIQAARRIPEAQKTAAKNLLQREKA